MREVEFEEVLRSVKLPMGTLLKDGTTYRITPDFYSGLPHAKDLSQHFKKFLVLSDGCFNVVGGVLPYWEFNDIQVTVFEEYRDQGYMSAIHKNGILRSELPRGQHVSLVTKEIRSMDDFLKRHYLLKNAGIPISNLPEVYQNLHFWCRDGSFNYDEETFINTFTISEIC